MDLRDKFGVNKNLYNEVICPVCGQITLDSFWICENCNWECDDPNIPADEESGPNHCTVTKYKEKMSKKLAYILRHSKNPQFVCLEGGWADIDVITKEMRIGKNFLEQIVINDQKKRFSFDDAKKNIRANNGHSIPGVIIDNIKKEPPEFLYHGTATRFLNSILKDGLRPMSRLNVQLTNDYGTAKEVGARHGESIVLKIRAKDFVADGGCLLLSPNGIWITEFISSKYIEISK